jgi:hypothetical protein
VFVLWAAIGRHEARGSVGWWGEGEGCGGGIVLCSVFYNHNN